MSMKKRNGRKRRRKNTLNCIHAAILVVLAVYTLHGIYLGAGITTGNFVEDIIQGVKKTGVNELFTFIGAIAFILFGIVGIYEFAYSNGLWILYPPIYRQLRERRDNKTAEIMMKTYFEKDKRFLQTVEMERFKEILRILKLTEGQFNQVGYELLRVRSMSYDNMDDLINGAQQLVLNKHYIIDLTQIPIQKRVYHDVNYFINMYTAVYNEEIRKELGRVMSSYMYLIMGKSISDIDYIVIPPNSNLLFGLSVGELLEKPILNIQEKPRIHRDYNWDGHYHYDNTHKNKIIILHDVLVTGNRVIDAVKKLPKDTFEVLYLFCLVKYEHLPYETEENIMDGLQIQKDQIKCLLAASEKDIKRILKE